MLFRWPPRGGAAIDLKEVLTRLVSGSGLTVEAMDGSAFGCQFVNFKLYVLNEYLPWRLRDIPWYGLRLMKKVKMYHWGGPRLRSLVGYQMMVVGRKE